MHPNYRAFLHRKYGEINSGVQAPALHKALNLMIVMQTPVFLAELQAPVLAGSVGAAFTLLVKRYCTRYRWFGGSLRHHTHTDPVPRIGGLAVCPAIALVWMLANSAIGHTQWMSALPILLAAIPVLCVGAYDDLRHASPSAKILAQLAGAVILIATSGDLHGISGAFALLFVAPWLVIATNSFNLIDGVDGLAAGSAIIMASALAVINLAAGNVALAMLSALTAAACLGFLPFNLSRTRIFLGDSGSLTIGFILAAISLETPRITAFPWAAVVLFGYPLTETTLSIVRRTLKGRSIVRPDREHLHHKLRHARFTSLQSAIVLCLVALAFSVLGVMVALDGSMWYVAAAVVLFLAIAKSFRYLRTRNLRLLRRRLAPRPSPEETLPDIAGYLPFK